ncbi:MAG: hypothetical protein Q4B42_03155 [Oscillospiraceae bacterium]|nr:hypothetical protein [Oscillospiraceae bacterium]
MIICNHCGSEEADSAVYCTKCGAKLEKPAGAESGAAQPLNETPPVQNEGGSPFAGVQPPLADAGAYTRESYGSSPYGGTQRTDKDWAGIAALICGIVSMPCCLTCGGGILLGILAVVFGIIGINSANRSLAIAGLICGGVGLLSSIVFCIFAFATASFGSGYSGSHDVYDFFEHFTDGLPL